MRRERALKVVLVVVGLVFVAGVYPLIMFVGSGDSLDGAPAGLHP